MSLYFQTIYIKQIALIVIMAQIGCYVPARHAVVSVRHRIMSRLENCDDMEHNMSTFATEMKGISQILTNITKNSLILVDELGRGTSNIDGNAFQILQ
jgi:DNA mismatch repair ATPase MutS